jgi:hypothetical protein
MNNPLSWKFRICGWLTGHACFIDCKGKGPFPWDCYRCLCGILKCGKRNFSRGFR